MTLPRFMPFLPWLAALVWLASFVLTLWQVHRRRKLWTHPILGVGLVITSLPVFYSALVWLSLMSDRYLRIERPWITLVTWLASTWVTWRLLGGARHRTKWRRRAVEFVTSTVVLIAGLGAAGLQWGHPLDRLTVLIAVDRSRSIDLVPGVQSRIRTELKVAEASMRRRDRIGTIAFASTALTEDPPRPKTALPAPQRVELGRDGTDIGAAIRRSLAEVPSDTAARIVIISDGVANRGDALEAAAAAVAAEVPVDVVPLDQRPAKDVRVVDVRAPSRTNDGESIDLHLVTSATDASEIEVRVKRDGRLIARSRTKVSAGEDVLTVREPPPGPGLHRYDVEVTALDKEKDESAEDNEGSVFVRVRGPATALVIEGEAGKGQFIESALRQAKFIVRGGTGASLPGDLAGMAQYDVIFLSDVPAHELSPEQLSSLGQYVRDLGGGLVLLGGDRSMGPGGYSQTPVEEISPISFDIKQDRRRASLAEVILIDYSGSMGARVGSRTKLELANEASVRSATLLGAGDQLGVAHVDTTVSWTVPLAPVTDKRAIESAIRAVGPGGGGIYTDLALRAGYAKLRPLPVNLKHVLLFADGGDAERLTGCRSIVAAAERDGITTSVISLGKGSDVPELEMLSRIGKGRFYLIEDARRLPAVFTQETILAARSAINEGDFHVALGASGAPTRGIDFSQAPILKGYVVGIPKDRTNVLLTGPEGDPILAAWSVGMGRSAIFTSDLKDRWGTAWTHWSGASTMVVQTARYVLRTTDDPHVHLQASTSGGKLHVRAEVLGDDGRAETFRRLTARVIGPSGKKWDMRLEPVGAGSYAADLPLSRPGAFVVTVRDDVDKRNIATTAAVLSAGEEMRPTGSDRALLKRISTMTGGKVRDTLAGVFRDRSAKRFSYQPLSSWLLTIASILLVLMVGVRRLSLPSWRNSSLVQKFGRLRSSPSRKQTEQVDPVPTLSRLEQLHRESKRRSGATGQPSIPLRTPSIQHARSASTSENHLRSAPWQQQPPTTSRTPSPRTSSPPRQLTAAEILLQRRKGRRRQ